MAKGAPPCSSTKGGQGCSGGKGWGTCPKCNANTTDCSSCPSSFTLTVSGVLPNCDAAANGTTILTRVGTTCQWKGTGPGGQANNIFTLRCDAFYGWVISYTFCGELVAQGSGGACPTTGTFTVIQAESDSRWDGATVELS